MHHDFDRRSRLRAVFQRSCGLVGGGKKGNRNRKTIEKEMTSQETEKAKRHANEWVEKYRKY
tara:strand:- start:395 stop:580 length:186 start_codon:yes stop_codon:yes gene_type:complete